MFDISMGEISLAALVAFVVLGPKDMLKAYHHIKLIVVNIKKEIEKYIHSITHSIDDEDVVQVVLDDDGNPQKAYNLDKIMQKLKTEINPDTLPDDKDDKKS